jgi:hypothetical protein
LSVCLFAGAAASTQRNITGLYLPGSDLLLLTRWSWASFCCAVYLLQELLLPTQRNITVLYLPGSGLIRTQQWLQHMIDQIELPIVNGTFVLVSTADLNPAPLQDQVTGPAGTADLNPDPIRQYQDTGLAGGRPSSTTSTGHDRAPGDVSDPASGPIRVDPAESAAIPWRLRQVAAVRVGPGMAPADAQVVLVGGQEVRAGAVADVMLEEVADVEVCFSDCQGSLGRSGEETRGNCYM